MKTNNEINAKKIAELAGVSPSTVSMVLNDKGGEFRIAEKTREKIRETADELGYHHVARTRSKKRSIGQTMICAFCPSFFDRGPTGVIYNGIQKYIAEQRLNYEMILFPYETGSLEGKAAFISPEFASGVLMLGLGEKDVEFLEASKFNVPIVLFNRTAKGYCSVLTDDYAVGGKTMSHFVKRGHRKFGIVSPNYSSRALSFRTMGFRDKYQSQNFASVEAFLAPTSFGEDSDEGGYEAMQRILHSDTRPTALFLPSDNMVSGVIRSIHENGLSVPKDLEIISYGNKIINQVVEPNISSYAPPNEELSYNCAKILHQCIRDNILADNVKISIDAECIFRESCPETGFFL